MAVRQTELDSRHAVDEKTRDRLLAINRGFYRRMAADFSRTRDHAWPGWARVLEHARWKPGVRLEVLDAGCGNGRFAAFLSEASRERDGEVHYLGIDASDELLALARERSLPALDAEFRYGDLLDPHSDPDIPARVFDLVCLFGVLHHVPGFDARSRLVERLAGSLAAGGILAVTCWRFGADARFRERTIPWDVYNRDEHEPIDPTALEPGDHLLRWGRGDEARYCHFADAGEVARLIERVTERGLRVADRYRADGRSDALNDYLVFRAPCG